MHNETTEPAGNPQAPPSIWNRSFLILFFANMSFNMGMYMSSSLLSIFADHLGASTVVIGFIISAFGISSILFRFIAAPIMDTYNRKHLVIIAALMLSVAFGGYSISTNVSMLICFRLLQGCSMVFGNACCLAMVADMLPKEKYSSGLGYYALAQVVSSAIGPSVGLALVDLTNFRVTYALAAFFMLFAGFLTSLIKFDFTRTRKLKLSLNSIIAKEALLPAGFHFFMIFGASGVISFLYLFARERSITGNIGLYFTVSAATMLLSRPLVGKLTDKYGVLKIAVPAVFCTIISLFIICWSTTLISLLIGSVVSALGQGAFNPAIQALTMKAVPNERRGAASSTSFIAQDAGAMIGPILAGQIIQLFGYVAMWHVMVIPYAVGALILIIFRSKVTRIEEEFAAR